MKLLFYCNALPDDIRARRKIATDSPAATRKVVNACKACREAGIDAHIVSMGRGKVSGFGWHSVMRDEIEGIPTTFGPMLHIPVISYFATGFWMAWFAFKHRGARDETVHLFYNQYTLYLPSLFLLTVLRRRTSVDIEDGPLPRKITSKKNQKRRFGSEASPYLFARFINSGALLANSALAAGTPVRPTMPYYGAVDGQANRIEKSGYPINILISGLLEPATGITLLIQSLKIMDCHNISTNINFFVTGQGNSLKELEETSRSLKNITVTIFGRISNEAYRNILRQSDIGLSLKLIAGPYSDTTFPSKVIEYAENGLMIISTDISDVRLIFGKSIRYLTTDCPSELAKIIISAAQNPRNTRTLGRQAQHIITDRFSFLRAGEVLKKFFFGAHL